MAKCSPILVLLFAALAGPSLAAQATRRVSVDSGGAQANQQSAGPAITPDGRYVAFHSVASNLFPGDLNADFDVFVRDILTGSTEIVSASASGGLSDGDSLTPSISADGRYVAFESDATNLVPADESPDYDVYVRDRVAGTTEKASVDSNENQADAGASRSPVISADGRYVAFYSSASDLVAGDTNGVPDVFVRDRVAGTTELVSVSSAGVQGNWISFGPSITADGRFIAFTSDASTLVANDTTTRDVFVRDLLLQTTRRVSLGSDGLPGNADSYSGVISADARYVAFASLATDLVPADTNFRADIFVRDRLMDTTERVSVNTGEGQASNWSRYPSISADGRFVTFESLAENLVVGDVNEQLDVFVRDRSNGTTERVSLDSDGVPGNLYSKGGMISADGRWIAFESGANNLVPGDTNMSPDIFVRDREATSFASLCGPGLAGVAACPCANPPSGPARGCENSAATGGAKLTASGAAHLSADSLVFTTSGEKPTALSIVLQGTTFVDTGTIYGQGVRCVGGSLKRLYARSAVGGSITAPDFGAGDPSVSAQSAAKGDPIQPGQPRWYLVYYRDNNVLGGCSPTSNFNATQTGQVSWVP